MAMTPSPTEDTPNPENAGGEAAPTPVVAAHEPDVLKRHARFSAREFFGTGFLVSIGLHLLLAILGIFWAISKYTSPPPKEPDTVFSSGAGGGTGGEKPTMSETRMRARPMNLSTPSRIVARNSAATIALPSSPVSSQTSFAAGLSGSAGGSRGAGGGAGGGSGTGLGIGSGGGKFNVSRFVMGSRIHAAKIAVYMDCSGSMVPYLKRVEQQIREQFPDADIFSHNAIRILVHDGEVSGGHKEGKSKAGRSAMPGVPSQTDPEKLTPEGRRIFKAYGDNFDRGSVGAWTDIMLRQGKYDALVVFSDFQDGVIQYGKSKDGRATPIFEEHYMAKSTVDTRKNADKAWEREWIAAFTKARSNAGPKLYLFTTSESPQAIWQECVKASDGDIKNVAWLRDPNGKPPEDPEGVTEAERISARNRNKRPAVR